MYVLIESNTAAREAMADAIRLDNPQISRRVGLMRQISGAKVGASGRKPSPLANTNRESRDPADLTARRDWRWPAWRFWCSSSPLWPMYCHE